MSLPYRGKWCVVRVECTNEMEETICSLHWTKRSAKNWVFRLHEINHVPYWTDAKYFFKHKRAS